MKTKKPLSLEQMADSACKAGNGFSKHPQHTPTCIRWTGAHDDDGYGRMQVGHQWKSAHRVAWENQYGPIQKGLVVDHICRVRDCIEVTHMELVTPRENTLRGLNPCAINARKQFCNHGHKLNGETMRIRYDGHRECIPCSRRRVNAYGKRRRAIAHVEGRP